MSRLVLIALAGAPAACTTWWSLPELPVVGGTSAERRLVRSELIAFDQAVGEGRVRLVSFEFGRLDDDAYGSIRGGRRITVEPGLEPDVLTILGWDSEGWWMPTDRCLRPGQGVFVTEDRVFWSSWIEGTELRWAPFLPN